ncbi:peptidoglycan DD-metalloendopeptidase family protein [Niveispirillum fermenti]|uniref:peptidoglycan DD-metalloendopeptidase family protein n=1 Tax=Niveispirillum fermenti TaxID=1233113 RepID=UPI003A8AD852
MIGIFKRSRQVIIVEDDGEAKPVTFADRHRPLLLAATLAVAVTTSIGWIATTVALHSSRNSIAQVDQGAQGLARQLADSREHISRIAGELENAREALGAALEEEQASRARVQAALDVLIAADRSGSKQTPRQVLAAVRTELAPLRIGVAEGGSHLRAAQESLQMVTDVSHDIAARRAQAAMAALALAIDGLDAPADAPPTLVLAGQGLARTLAEAQAESLRNRSEAETMRAERDAMAATLAAAEQRMGEVAAGQVALLTRLAEHTELRSGAIEGELRETGIDLEQVLTAMEDGTPRGVGGPLVGLPDLPTAALPPEARVALTQLESRLERQARLRAVKHYLPLTPPVDNFYVSSGFGSRRDPFTNDWASHTGLDLVAREGSPVTLPAAGRVIRAGYDPGYGNMVEVDHGFGIHTRYAHMKKISVKRGENLDPGRALGTLGSTGRSSGPHLHYEVLLDGKPVNPLRFMERGRHLCEG